MNFHNLWGPEFTPLHEKPDCHTHQLTILILLAILCGVSWISDFKKIIHNENYLRLVFLRQLLTIFWYTNLKTISPKNASVLSCMFRKPGMILIINVLLKINFLYSNMMLNTLN